MGAMITGRGPRCTQSLHGARTARAQWQERPPTAHTRCPLAAHPVSSGKCNRFRQQQVLVGGGMHVFFWGGA